MFAMEGKTCVVTGASSGIGKEAARGIAELGAHLVMVCRNPSKGEAAAEEIRRSAKGPVELVLADLARLDSVRKLAATLIDKYPRIDVLVNNAGVYRLRRGETVDGFEETFAVNHLAPFLLTNLLLERLRSSCPARVVTVASGAHFGATLDFEDLHSARGYSSMKVYSRSKLCNVMFTYALARRLEGTDVTANCLHPGFVASNLGSGNRIPVRPVMLLLRPFVLGPKQGADTVVWLASSPEVDGISGGYYEKRRPRVSSPQSVDYDAQERLWDESASLVGLKP